MMYPDRTGGVVAVGLDDGVGDVLASEFGQRLRGGDLHLLVYLRGPHVERAPEDEREPEDVVDLVR